MAFTGTRQRGSSSSTSATFAAGLGFTFSYIVVSAIGEVYAAAVFQSLDFFTTLLTAFVIITIVFNLLPRKKQGLPCARQFVALAGLNVATCLAWLGLFAGLKYVEPAIVVAFMIALGPITTVIVNHLIRGSPPSRQDILASLIIVGLGVYLVLVIWLGRGGLTWNHGTLFGLTASIIAGAALATTGVFIKHLYEIGLQGRQIIANRFYLTVSVLLFLVDYGELHITLTQNVTEVLIIAICTLLLPIWLIQMGVKRLEPIAVNMLLCSAPLVTFGIQFFDSRLTQSVPTLIGNVLIVAIAAWIVRSHARSDIM